MSVIHKTLASLFLLAFLAACGENLGLTDINPNFPSLGNTGIEPSASVNSGSGGQVIDLAPTVPNEDVPTTIDYSGALASIADQGPDQVLCVIIDGEGGNANLEVCDANTADRETASADQVCPDENVTSHCASNNDGSVPDFCSITGARDYVISIINLSGTEVRVAYQVVDVSGLPNRSCEDLNITEDSITADTQ